MPATSPKVSEHEQGHLARLGARIKDRRKELRVTAEHCAQAAGISRMTLHRIEDGNPSVTIGAYLSAVVALGLTLTIPLPDKKPEEIPVITVSDYPGLRSLAWQVEAGTQISETDALNLYERNWRHLDHHLLTDEEKLFIQHLADAYSHGALLV